MKSGKISVLKMLGVVTMHWFDVGGVKDMDAAYDESCIFNDNGDDPKLLLAGINSDGWL